MYRLQVISYLPLGMKGPYEERARGCSRCRYITMKSTKPKKEIYLKQIWPNIIKSKWVVHLYFLINLSIGLKKLIFN